MRGFLAGVIWGGVVAGAGLAVISQVAPLPGRDTATAPAPAAPEPVPQPLPQAPEAEVQPEILQKGPDTDEVVEDAPAAEAPAAPAEPVAEAPVVAQPEPPADPAPTTQPADTQTELQPPADVPTVEPAAPAAPAAPEAQGDLPAALAEARPGIDSPAEPGAPAAEPAPAPVDAVPEPPAPDDVLLRPDPAPVEEDPAPAPVAPSDGGALAEAPGLQPDAGIETKVPGVTTDRLPRIGDDEGMTADAAPGTEGEALPELAGVAAGGTTPLELFAREFDNPEGKPLFSIILIDEGVAPEDRGNLAALPFPVTFAIDPLAPDSADAARIYRQAGQEVAMLAAGIPAGATAGDLEQSLQALDMALPEAVVVLDRPDGELQAQPDLARQLVPIVAEQGRGLLTYDRGFNPADQVARREGVPSAVIFRVLDSEGESIPKMRNYLDRAAFKAAQEGKVVVIGRAHPETVAAILEWTVEGRAATVALAPVTAVLERAPSP